MLSGQDYLNNIFNSCKLNDSYEKASIVASDSIDLGANPLPELE